MVYRESESETMGLDTIEFILEVEEKFSISISEKEALGLVVVGDLAKYIASETEGTRSEYDYESALQIIIEMLVRSYGVPKGKANAQSAWVTDLGLD